jgi:hypothetical protein
VPCLALSLFVTGILFVDHVQLPFPPDHFAVFTALFDGRFNFHVLKVFGFRFSVSRSAAAKQPKTENRKL